MITLGLRLRGLARHRIALAVTLAAALLAAASSAYDIRLTPPGLTPAAGPTAGAHTQILIDDIRVSVLSAQFDSASFDDLHEGALLASALIVGAPTRDYVAAAAHVPVGEIAFSAPQTEVDPPPPPPRPGQAYSVTVAARPTVPIVDVYAQAPTPAAARQLAAASATGLRRVLAGPGNFGLRARQLGDGAPVASGSGGSLTGAARRFVLVAIAGWLITVLLGRRRPMRDAKPRPIRGRRRRQPSLPGVVR